MFGDGLVTDTVGGGDWLIVDSSSVCARMIAFMAVAVDAAPIEAPNPAP